MDLPGIVTFSGSKRRTTSVKREADHRQVGLKPAQPANRVAGLVGAVWPYMDRHAVPACLLFAPYTSRNTSDNRAYLFLLRATIASQLPVRGE